MQDILSISAGPTTLTVAAKQQQTAQQITQGSAQLYLQMLQSAQALWNLMWANPQSLSPQQVCDALGASAKSAFDRFASLVTFLQSNFPAAAPSQLQQQIAQLAVPAGFTVTENKDSGGNFTGTVTITEPTGN